MSKQIAKSSNKRIKKNNVPSIKHPSTISPSTEKMSLMNISQRGMEITDKSTHLMNQKILADFLSSIPLDKGWWFRVPSINDSKKRTPRFKTDQYLPQVGCLFGLDEHAAAHVFVEMELLNFKNGTGTSMNLRGWDNFKSLFLLSTNKVEIESTKMIAMNGRQYNRWFVKFGQCEYNASKIAAGKMTPPTKLVSRRCTAFVCGLVKDILFRGNKIEYALSSPSNEEETCEDDSNNENSNNVVVLTNEREEEGSNSGKEVEIRNNSSLLDSSSFPLIRKYNIPVDDTTLNSILRELIYAKKKLSGENFGGNSFVLNNDNNPTKNTLFIEIPSGNSKSTKRNFVARVKESIEWRSSTGDESTADGVYDVIMGLENVSPNSFLDVAKEKGYSTQLTPRISAIFWLAMSEAAGLRVRQQRIIRQYLAFHLGNRIAVSESDIAEVGSNFVPYISEDVVVDAKEYGVKSVKISYRGIDNLIINYADELFSDLNNIR